jgi:hypothetical protein
MAIIVEGIAKRATAKRLDTDAGGEDGIVLDTVAVL